MGDNEKKYPQYPGISNVLAAAAERLARAFRESDGHTLLLDETQGQLADLPGVDDIIAWLVAKRLVKQIPYKKGTFLYEGTGELFLNFPAP